MSDSPNVLLLASFVQAKNCKGSFGDFLFYMDRPDAFKAEGKDDDPLYQSEGYLDYMNNGEKSDGLFTAYKDNLSNLDKYAMSKVFNDSQAKECPLFRGVISFDNDFLREYGLINERDMIARHKIKEVARAAVTKLIQESGLELDSVMWAGAIHNNTDNIHIHYSFVELDKVKRRKDMLPQKALDKAKTTVANKIIGSEQTILRTKLLREELLPEFTFRFNWGLESVENILSSIPTDIKWEYGRKDFAPYKDKVNDCVDILVQSDLALAESFSKYKGALEKYAEDLRKMYGEGERQLWQSVVPKRLEDFYYRAGNLLLKEWQGYIEKKREGMNLDQQSVESYLLGKKLDASWILFNSDLSGDALWGITGLLEAGLDQGSAINFARKHQNWTELEFRNAIEYLSAVNPSDANILQNGNYSYQQFSLIALAMKHHLDYNPLLSETLTGSELERVWATIPKVPIQEEDDLFLTQKMKDNFIHLGMSEADANDLLGIENSDTDIPVHESGENTFEMLELEPEENSIHFGISEADGSAALGINNSDTDGSTPKAIETFYSILNTAEDLDQLLDLIKALPKDEKSKREEYVSDKDENQTIKDCKKRIIPKSEKNHNENTLRKPKRRPKYFYRPSSFDFQRLLLRMGREIERETENLEFEYEKDTGLYVR